ncbi:hypothetical protein GCM10009593_21940 [Microlunatus antarcticus]
MLWDMKSSNTDSNVLALGDEVRYTSNMRSIEPTFDRTPDPLRSIAMSVAFAEPVTDRPTADVRVGRPAPAPTRTTPRRPGPGVGPTARPRRLRFTAPAVAGSSTGARACAPARAVEPVSRSWRLTERGLAVVLVMAAALVAASIAVVGLTALRVTGESYQPSHSVAAPVLVQP